MKALLGYKVGITSVFVEDKFIPVTVIKAGPCYVLDKLTENKNGYNAVRIGFEEVKKNREKKPLAGISKKANVPVTKHIREVKEGEGAVGDVLTVKIFKDEKTVDIIGYSKGKGFSGAVKRWHFSGYFKSHGSKALRRVGAIGCRLTPGRVFKNHKMAGHLGVDKTTIKKLKIVDVDEEKNVLLVKGNIPGAKNSLLFIKAAQ